MMKHTKKGFTLIEILIVFAIIGILVFVVFLVLNPRGRLADSRNRQRMTNIMAIGNAMLNFNIAHNGEWPAGIPILNTSTSPSGFIKGTPDCTFSQVTASNHPGCEWADDATLVNPSKGNTPIVSAYIPSIPSDIKTDNGYTHYFVALTPDQLHVVVISDSMETDGVATNIGGTQVDYRQF